MIILRIFKYSLFAAIFAVISNVCAQEIGKISNEVKVDEFKCVILIYDQSVRNAGSYVGRWRGELFFLETKMLGVGPILLRKKEIGDELEIYAPSKISSQCNSMELSFERVEKKFPHAVAGLTSVKPIDFLRLEASLLPGKGEFGKNNLSVRVYKKNLETEDFVMYRADNFQEILGQAEANSKELNGFARKFCQIVNGNGMYANMIEGCILSTKGQ
ncbi:hypothetical protein QFZ83_006430 [Variovorax sp. W1I1]|nr:hypothetical protein [Variovorax sp. W1I1]